MELYEKKVLLRCPCGDIILGFDGALSLLTQSISTMVNYSTDAGINDFIDLINNFIELGKQADSTLTINYDIEDEENPENITNRIYYLIIYSLRYRIDYLHKHIFG